MNAEDWRQIEPILDQALELDEAARNQYLDSACGEDSELRSSLERLLAAAVAGSSPLSRSLGGVAAGVLGAADPPPDLLDRRIGPYRAVQELGRGGMGVVYLAERDDAQFTQRVALKVIRTDRRDAARLQRRFLDERQILARLEHPHIARLMDGGVLADGSPWLAMEYVNGVTLTSYCREKSLGVATRLALFLDVCDAVDYAHRQLVVHRDLKPSNVLVTSDGQVKLLDFGIAKLIGEQRAAETATATHAQPFTPDYASPEQLLGKPITTGSDVYSLGVMLYELLTGQRPFSVAHLAMAEWVTAVTSKEADAPSRVSGAPRELAGDLDLIVLKALRKEPARRYPSPAELARDLRNYLAGRPVSARPDTRGYRLSKFVQRNRASAIGAGLVLASLVAGLVAVTRQSAATAREAKKATAVKNFLIDVFREGDPAQSKGAEATVRDLLARGVQRVDSTLATEPESRFELRSTLGSVYQSLGLYAEGDSSYARAVTIARDLYGPQSMGYAQAVTNRTGTLSQLGEYAAADSMLGEAIAVFRTAGADSLLHRALNQAGVVKRRLGKVADARALMTEAVAVSRRTSPYQPLEVAGSLADLAVVELEASNPVAADTLIREAMPIFERLLPPDNPQRLVAFQMRGSVFDNLGAPDSAVAIHAAALKVLRTLLPPGHQNIGIGLNNLSASRARMGDTIAAAAGYGEAYTSLAKSMGADNPGVQRARLNWARMLVVTGAVDSAEHVAKAALRALEAAVGTQHADVARALGSLGFVYERSGRLGLAEQTYRRALAVATATLPAGHRTTTSFQVWLGRTLVASGKAAEAEPILRSALEANRKALPDGEPDLAFSVLALGKCLGALGQREAAATLLEEAIQRFSRHAFLATASAEANRALKALAG